MDESVLIKLKDVIDSFDYRIQNAVECYFNKNNGSNIEYEEFDANVDAKSTEGEKGYGCFSYMCKVRMLNPNKNDDHVFDCLEAAALLHRQSKHELNNNKIDVALVYMSEAEFQLKSYEIMMYSRQRDEEKRLSSKSGGDGRALRTKPIKDKIIELLASKKPDGGWNSKSEAARAIKDDIDIVNKEIRVLEPSRIFKLLTDWMAKDEAISKVFVENQSENCRKKQEKRDRDRNDAEHVL